MWDDERSEITRRPARGTRAHDHTIASPRLRAESVFRAPPRLTVPPPRPPRTSPPVVHRGAPREPFEVRGGLGDQAEVPCRVRVLSARPVALKRRVDVSLRVAFLRGGRGAAARILPWRRRPRRPPGSHGPVATPLDLLRHRTRPRPRLQHLHRGPEPARARERAARLSFGRIHVNHGDAPASTVSDHEAVSATNPPFTLCVTRTASRERRTRARRFLREASGSPPGRKAETPARGAPAMDGRVLPAPRPWRTTDEPNLGTPACTASWSEYEASSPGGPSWRRASWPPRRM